MEFSRLHDACVTAGHRISVRNDAMMWASTWGANHLPHSARQQPPTSSLISKSMTGGVPLIVNFGPGVAWARTPFRGGFYRSLGVKSPPSRAMPSRAMPSRAMPGRAVPAPRRTRWYRRSCSWRYRRDDSTGTAGFLQGDRNRLVSFSASIRELWSRTLWATRIFAVDL